MASHVAKIWGQITCCFHVKSQCDWGHLCQVVCFQVGETVELLLLKRYQGTGASAAGRQLGWLGKRRSSNSTWCQVRGSGLYIMPSSLTLVPSVTVVYVISVYSLSQKVLYICVVCIFSHKLSFLETSCKWCLSEFQCILLYNIYIIYEQ